MRAGGGGAHGNHAQTFAGVQRLGVQIPLDFHVVGDEAEGYQHDAFHWGFAVLRRVGGGG